MQTTTASTDQARNDIPVEDFLLAPPRSADRIACRLDPRDLRRLNLYAVLTAAGIAPWPGDREAIEELSVLPDRVHEALHHWLSSGR